MTEAVTMDVFYDDEGNAYTSSVDLCGCPMCRNILEARRKFLAAMMLIPDMRRPNEIIVPTESEWIGMNLLERDDEL